MDYKEAVALALAGEERGFGYLYANTQKSKFYLALQYMKDEAMAEDVLQEAYMKAFSNLDKLEQPEAFPAWLGRIVANTAKNMLAKKTPMYFADVEVDEEGQRRPIEDEKVENQPEIAYTQKETQELVHELIDSLSDEQRFCVLMFHIEGASISEIAAAMDCSENTVKSRLNYGRKNLKAKAEELQKKGYKLYNVAPLPLLLLLLRSEEQAMAADGTLSAAGNRVADAVFDQFTYAPDGTCRPEWNDKAGNADGAGTQMGTQSMTEGIKKAGKTGLLHTQAAKIAIVTVVGLLTVGTLYKISHPETSEPLPLPTQETVQTSSVVSTTETAGYGSTYRKRSGGR